MDKKDISKRTVMVLLILTLVISVVGTWTILSQPATVYKTTEIYPSPGGEVSVGITDGPQTSTMAAPVKSVDDNARVRLNILQ